MFTAAETVAASVPVPGQVVEVRGSTGAVADVRAQGLPRSRADEATSRLSHAVEPQSLDEDGVGEYLIMVWELEVGRSLIGRMCSLISGIRKVRARRIAK